VKAVTEDQSDSFNSSRAEVFEALGHPTRMRILQVLRETPLGFTELKRAVGIESNGLLAFHLGKMKDLVRLNIEGSYALTDEGKEALRIVEASKGQGGLPPSHPVRVPHLTAVLATLVVVLIILAVVSAVEYNQIQGLESRPTVTPAAPVASTATIYAGTATTPSSQGTAHVNVTFVYDGPDIPIPVFLTATSSNGTSIAAYQCRSRTSCAPISTIYMKPSNGSEEEETFSFYFGSPITSGMNYSCAMTIMGIGEITGGYWGTIVAQ
jgi:DNA-binding transcriptional ArsR family regulator